MAKPYAELRGYLAQADIDQKYLCELMNRSQTYLTQRITGRKPWTQEDMYFLMDTLDIPYDTLHRIFPPEGIHKARESMGLRQTAPRRHD